MTSIPELLCEAARIMFDRRLTDMAGGNISARDGDTVYMSPRFSGSRHHWQLTPELLVSGCWADDAVAQQSNFSREGWAHLMIYRSFPDAQAVFHAHPFHVMPFAAAARPMDPVLEATQKFGVIELTRSAPAHSKDLANYIVEALQGKEDRMRKQAAAVLIPYHGVIVAGKDVNLTLDALERIDTNAYCILSGKILE